MYSNPESIQKTLHLHRSLLNFFLDFHSGSLSLGGAWIIKHRKKKRMIVTSHHFAAVSTAWYSGRTGNRSSLPASQICSLTGHFSELEELPTASCAGIIHLPDWCVLLEHRELFSGTDQKSCITTTRCSSSIYSWAVSRLCRLKRCVKQLQSLLHIRRCLNSIRKILGRLLSTSKTSGFWSK